MQMIFHFVSAVTLLYVSLPASAGDGSQAGDCTSGFMSRDRMDAVLNDISIANIPKIKEGAQVVFPGMNFTCSGTIQSWTFGAEWHNDSTNDSFPQLQIWRPSGGGSYTKVGNNTIMTTQNNSKLYQHHPSSPLLFQAGDVLGYYQPKVSTSKLELYLENRQGHLGHSSAATSAQLVANPYNTIPNIQLVIDVVTDPPGCECGFMSEERMKILLGMETVNIPIRSVPTQQITPDMTFTCNGTITKWIFAAAAGPIRSGPRSAEFQLWRHTGSDVYQKINGTLIIMERAMGLHIYEYDALPPIPFQAGDILGTFVPHNTSQALDLYSENTSSPTNYYYRVDLTERLYDMLVISDHKTFLRSRHYHPMVSVEIGASTPTSAYASQVMTSDFMSLAETAIISPTTIDQNLITSQLIDSMKISPVKTVTISLSKLHLSSITNYKNVSPSISVSPPHPFDSGGDGGLNTVISGGIAAAVLLLKAVVVVVVVAVLVCMLQWRSDKEVDIQLKEKSNKYSVENPIYTVKNIKNVKHREQINKDSVENPVKTKKAVMDVQCREQTDKDSVENPIYAGNSVHKALSLYQVAQPTVVKESEVELQLPVDSNVDTHLYEVVDL